MFDVKSVNKRYFGININGKELEVEPPKLKALKRITSLAKSRDEEAMDDLEEALCMILSKNKANIKVTSKITEELDFDEINAILTAYFEWLSNAKNSKN